MKLDVPVTENYALMGGIMGLCCFICVATCVAIGVWQLVELGLRESEDYQGCLDTPPSVAHQRIENATATGYSPATGEWDGSVTTVASLTLAQCQQSCSDGTW